MALPAASQQPSPGRVTMVAIVCAAAGAALFQLFGNAGQGYIDTRSLFYWWGFQWVNPGSETEHGWLILGLSGWLLRRNLLIADRGLRIADWTEPVSGNRTLQTGDGRPETGNRGPENGNQSPETGNRRPETGGWRSESGSAESGGATTESGVELHPELIESPVSGLRFPVCVAAILAGLALHALGFAAQQTRISIVAFLIFTWGVLRLAGGRRWGDAAMFPLAFMIFAMPLSALDEIGLPLRLWVTSAGERIAHVAGIEVMRSGTQLVAPDGRFNYDVAAPCSGVRSLMALTALSALIGYLNFRSWWRRVLVFGFCFPLVYLGNVTRIVAIIFAAQAGGPEWGDRAHQVMGYGVFVIVLGGVLLGVALIHRWWPEAAEQKSEVRSQQSAMAQETGVSRKMLAGVAVGIVTLVLAEMFFLHRLEQMPPRGQVGIVLAPDGNNPVELPSFLGTDWIGQRAEVSAVEREILPPDTGFSRKNYAFVADRTRDVFLSIVLSGRDRTSIHRPELCLVGQGWTIERGAQQTFRFPKQGAGAAENFRATVLHVRREISSPRGKVVVPQLIVYWFVGGNMVVPSNWQRFVQDAWNRVTHARADRWAYVLMQTHARDGEAAAIARMQTVLDGTLPAFHKPQLAE